MGFTALDPPWRDVRCVGCNAQRSLLCVLLWSISNPGGSMIVIALCAVPGIASRLRARLRGDSPKTI
jgi:hypothetical protein